MELKSITGLAERERVIPHGSGGAQPRERHRRAAGGLLRAAACAGGAVVLARGRKAPASSELIKKSFQTSAG